MVRFLLGGYIMTTISEKSKELDVRLLELKRWNFPQTNRILPVEGNKTVKYGDYVSFQSHHFIDIKIPDNANSSPLPAAYEQIMESRKQHRVSPMDELHIVQSITMLGSKSDFWDKRTDVMYITFIQMVNSGDWDYESVEALITTAMNKKFGDNAHQDKKPQWALYYSLDFCDLILFTKNIKHEEFHDVLWQLSLIRSKETVSIRDTFTMYSFGYEYLTKCFTAIHKKQQVNWDERMSISADISIPSVEHWKLFHNYIKDVAGIHPSVRRTSGRYDVRLTTNTLTGSQVLHFLYALDQFGTNDVNTSFGCYEINLMAKAWRNCPSGYDSHTEQTFASFAQTVMFELCSRYCKIYTNSSDYVQETMRSLNALLKNAFSEEFVISVLYSFVSFLSISLKCYEMEQTPELLKNLDAMTRAYFNALNTLALCTMHSERQFIQAPAFNATYFDVPPKLLAFYTAVANEVVEKLKTNEDAYYRFIITPDYRKDINVVPLEVSETENLNEHLAVIYLCERYFYDPQNAISLLCHEIGHYVGNRHRKERARLIFRSICFKLLNYTKASEIQENHQYLLNGESVICLLVDSLAEYLMELFESFSKTPIQKIEFHLKDVSNFLQNINFGHDLFINAIWRETIIARWIEALRGKIIDSDIRHKEIGIFLAGIQTPLNSTHLTNMFAADPECDFILETIARQIAAYVKGIKAQWTELNYEQSSKRYVAYCENVIQSFSETFADLQMVEIIGDKFSPEHYDSLFKLIDDSRDFQQTVRHDALLSVVAQDRMWDHWDKADKKDSPEQLMYDYVTEQIIQYISMCKEDNKSSELIINTLNAIESNDAQGLFNAINMNILRYRKTLINYCNNTLETLKTSFH